VGAMRHKTTSCDTGKTAYRTFVLIPKTADFQGKSAVFSLKKSKKTLAF
jgi:hypothetical protein